ncbi:hypothetical protein PV325_012197 [Microctonus aethiopoides]|nr:hypothetical protein PV325_012197 [Microctonus aethiopoides]
MKSAYEALLSIDSDTTNDSLIATWERIRNENVHVKFREHQRNRRRANIVGGNIGINDNRIQKNDAETVFNSRIKTGIITNLQHKDLSAFSSDTKQIMIDKVKPILQNDGNVNLTVV